MTLKEAKTKANKIGGVVDWWWSYSVYSAPEWKAFNGTHGYGVYVSKKARAYFEAEFKKEQAIREFKLTRFKRWLRLRNVWLLSILVKHNLSYLVIKS